MSTSTCRTNTIRQAAGPLACGMVFLGMVAPALAQEPSDRPALETALVYKADVMASRSDGGGVAGRFLDNLELAADMDLDRSLRWSGARLHMDVLSNSGGKPNDVAATLQGVDNIEVARPRAKLYQLWIEQEAADGQASVLAGLYDLNSEFYQTETAGLFIAPAFGIGSELASTGPNGPSIFPSTALAVRGRWTFAPGQAVQAAIIDAKAGVFDDPESVDLSFDNGALLIAEYQATARFAFRAGGWTYSRRQDDIRDVSPTGDPQQRRSAGLYASIEGPLLRGADRDVSGFVRAGLSDGRTTPYAGGWQAGVAISPALAGRPDSAFAIGVNSGVINARERANRRDAGADPSHAETALEATYSDQIAPHLVIQPDLQLVLDPGADAARGPVVVAAMRVTASF